MLLHEISFVLALKVCTPAYRILPVHTGSLKDLDTLSICEAYELCICNTFKTCDKFVIVSVVKELDIFAAVVESIFHKILDEFLCEIHVILDVIERHFRLDHPELGKVTWCV